MEIIKINNEGLKDVFTLLNKQHNDNEFISSPVCYYLHPTKDIYYTNRIWNGVDVSIVDEFFDGKKIKVSTNGFLCCIMLPKVYKPFDIKKVVYDALKKKYPNISFGYDERHLIFWDGHSTIFWYYQDKGIISFIHTDDGTETDFCYNTDEAAEFVIDTLIKELESDE